MVLKICVVAKDICWFYAKSLRDKDSKKEQNSN